MHFLAQKPWTPWNKANQERTWIAEQEEKERVRREAERAQEVRRQGDVEEQARMVAKIGEWAPPCLRRSSGLGGAASTKHN
jgi:hypothetical protein